MADVIDSTAEETKPGPASNPRSYRRLTAALVGGVIGGALVLVGGILFLPNYMQGRIDTALADARPAPELEQRIAAIEQRTETLADLPDTTSNLSGTLDDVQARLADLSGKVGQATEQAEQQSGGLSDLKDSQQQLAQRLDELEQRPVPKPDLGPIQAKVEAATKNVEDLRAFGEQLANRVNDVTGTGEATLRRVDTLTTAQAEAERRLNERTQQLADRLSANDTAMSAKFASLAQAEATLAAMQSALASQASEIGAVQANVAGATTKTDEALAKIEDRLASVDQRISERLDQDGRGVATAVALTDVNRALEDGSAFPTAQAVLEASAKSDETIARAAEMLRPSAPHGIPTREQLMSELAELDRVGVQASSEDWVEQTRSNIMGLVTVKRRDGTTIAGGGADKGGDAQPKLAAGDLAGAIAAVSARPDADQEAVGNWIERAKARADAEAAAELLRQHLGELLVRPN